MKKLTIPNEQNTKLLDDIISTKRLIRRTRLRRYRTRIVNRYKFYGANYSSLDNVCSYPALYWKEVKEDLISCYEQSNLMSNVRDNILRDIIECPYCMLNSPDTIDHYFDKSDYPEYSVFVPNLIPSCDTCNRKKSTLMFNDANKRMFIHFYLDDIPEYQFLFLRLLLEDDDMVPRLEIDLQFEPDEPTECYIKEHFRALDLIDKYKDKIGSKLTVELCALQLAKDGGSSVEEIRRMVNNYYLAYLTKYGHNYWETCMYEGMLNTPNFLERYFQ